jgi:bisphosphoglycerate-dependent phosphoglycerate mutase
VDRWRTLKEAGVVLKSEGFDVAHTSVLTLTIHTLWAMLDELHLAWIPVHHFVASQTSGITERCKA